MLKITDDNYNTYKQVYEILWNFKAIKLLHIDPNIEWSPVIILTSWEKKSKSIAKRGLKESLRDMLTMMLDLPDTMKTEISKQLTDKGLPSFYQLLSTIRDTPQKVLKRGKIKSLDEYYVVKEFLVDLNSDISDSDRQQLEKMFFVFETSSNKKKNGS